MLYSLLSLHHSSYKGWKLLLKTDIAFCEAFNCYDEMFTIFVVVVAKTEDFD